MLGLSSEFHGSSNDLSLRADQRSRIHEKWQCGAQINRGDEIGIFQFGGSSIIVAFEKDRIQFDDDLSVMSKQRIMIDVEVGTSLGKATGSGLKN